MGSAMHPQDVWVPATKQQSFNVVSFVKPTFCVKVVTNVRIASGR